MPTKTLEEIQRLYEAKWTTATRKAHKAGGGYFAGPGETYPLKDCSDASDAWGLAGHAADPDQVRANIKSWASKHSCTASLPDTAKAGTTKEDLTTPALSSGFAPKARVAQLTVRFLRDGAQSRNGRIYPRESVDRLIQSGQSQIADASAALLTCYTSHDAADRKDTFNLTGKITNVWREGTDAYAQFDIPDTTAGRDMVSLAQGGYLKTMSLRAKNAELKIERGYPVPIVTGQGLQLEGIDFTPTPGLEIAQIQGIVTESQEPQAVVEVFDLDTSTMLLETEEAQTMSQLSETAIHESIPLVTSKMQEAHGHLHEMCMPGKESGRSLSQANTDKIGKAHDAVAQALGIECRYDPGADAAVDGNQGGDTDGTMNDTQEQEEDVLVQAMRILLETKGTNK